MSIIDTPDEVYVSLKFIGFDFHPDIITKNLELEPVQVRVRGERWKQGHGGLSSVLSKVNWWAYNSKSYTPPIEVQDQINSHLRWTLSKLLPKKKELHELINGSRRAYLVIVATNYHFNLDTIIEPQLLEQVTELQIPFGFDMYSLNGTAKYLETEGSIEDLVMRLSKIVKLQQMVQDDEAALKQVALSLARVEDPAHTYKNALFNLLDADLGYLTDKQLADRFDTVIKTLREVYEAINASQILRERIKE